MIRGLILWTKFSSIRNSNLFRPLQENNNLRLYVLYVHSLATKVYTMITKLVLDYVPGSDISNYVKDMVAPVMVFPNATRCHKNLSSMAKSKIFSDLILVGNKGGGVFQWTKIHSIVRSTRGLDESSLLSALYGAGLPLDHNDVKTVYRGLCCVSEYNRIVCILIKCRGQKPLVFLCSMQPYSNQTK